jgi:hypothetical protein
MDPRATVQLHQGMNQNWSQDWALFRPTVNNNSLPSGNFVPVGPVSDPRYFVGDLAFLSTADQRRLAETFHLDVVGSIALVDRMAPLSPVDGHVFDAREPTPLEWYFTSGTDPVRTIRDDPFFTWELRDAYGQLPNSPPETTPTTLDQQRIAHNLAVSQGHEKEAEGLFSQIVARLETRSATRLSDGTRVIGYRYAGGVAPTISVYFLAAGPCSIDWELGIASIMKAPAPLSLVPPDPTLKQYGRPFVLPPGLWKAGYLYEATSEIRHRRGTEVVFGYITGGDAANQTLRPHLVEGDQIPLVTLR